MLSKTPIQLAVDVWGCAPSLLVVWPEVIQPWGYGLSGRANGSPPPPPGLLLLMPLSPWQTTADPHLHWTLSNTISRSGSVSWRVIFPFPWILVHVRICALLECRLCFPWPCWDPIIKSHWPSKVRFPGGSHSFCQIPRLGSLKWGSEPSRQWDNFLGIIILQIVNRPPGRYWICLSSCFWSSYHLFFLASSLSLDVGYLFLVSSSILLSRVVQ